MGPEHHNQEGRLAEILGSCLLGIYINKSSVFFSFIFFYFAHMLRGSQLKLFMWYNVAGATHSTVLSQECHCLINWD